MSRREQLKMEEEKFGLTRMTKAAILKLCKKNKLYVTPHLNDVLYLHYQGYTKIESLEDYTGLKCLWLESNAISELSGLDNLPGLRCLFIHNNLIKKIENLNGCRRLDTINLSNNYITTIENCGSEVLPELTTLNIANNKIQSMQNFEQLSACLMVSVLDLSHNRIDDIMIVGVLNKMPELRVLMLTGNPVLSMIPMYRKTMINECVQLTYLDNRPVFDRDRACAVAWKRGGYEEEKREHSRWIRADRKRIRDGVNATLELRIRKARERGEEPTVELLEPSDDEDDLPLAIKSKEDLSADKSRGHLGDGDSIYDEVEDGTTQQELYEAYANQLEEDLKNYETDSEPSKSDEEATDVNENNVLTSTIDQDVTATELKDNTNVTDSENNSKFEEKSKENCDTPTLELSNPKGFTESEIHTMRKIIIEQITKKPDIVPTEEVPMQFDSNLITTMHEDNKLDNTTNAEPLPPTNTSGSQTLIEEIKPTPIDTESGVPFDEHVSIIAQQHRDLSEAADENDSGSEDNYSNYDDIDSFVNDMSGQNTIRGFLTEYNEFLNTMQSKISESQQTIDELSKTKKDDECDGQQDISGDLDLDTIHQHLLAPKETKSQLSFNTKNYLPRQVHLFDLSLEDINTELEVLEDNARNGLTDMVDRIYRNREMYRNDSLENRANDTDERPDFISNYYENYCQFDKATVGTGQSDALDELRNSDIASAKQSGVRFYCNKIGNYLEINDDIEAAAAKDSITDVGDQSNAEIKEEVEAFREDDKKEGDIVTETIEEFADETTESKSISEFVKNAKEYVIEEVAEEIEQVTETIEEVADETAELISEEYVKNAKENVSEEVAEEIEEVVDEITNTSSEATKASLEDNVVTVMEDVVDETIDGILDKVALEVEESVLQKIKWNFPKSIIENVLKGPEEVVKDIILKPCSSTADDFNKIDNEENVEIAHESEDPENSITVTDTMEQEVTDDNQPKSESLERPALNAQDQLDECQYSDEDVDKIMRLEYIQSLIFGGPKLTDFVESDSSFQAGDFGMDAEGASRATAELRESSAYQKHMQRLRALDEQLDANINRIMLEASIECDMVNALEKYGDPFADNETNVAERAQKYCAEFMERVKNAKNK